MHKINKKNILQKPRYDIKFKKIKNILQFMQFLEQLKIKLFNKKVGSDEFGNEYYQGKSKRFVTYKGIAEPSKVPAKWHGWLHYTTNILPVQIDTRKHSWEKIHIPNLTGTKNAYSPQNTQAKKPYQTWQPK